MKKRGFPPTIPTHSGKYTASAQCGRIYSCDCLMIEICQKQRPKWWTSPKCRLWMNIHKTVQHQHVPCHKLWIRILEPWSSDQSRQSGFAKYFSISICIVISTWKFHIDPMNIPLYIYMYNIIYHIQYVYTYIITYIYIYIIIYIPFLSHVFPYHLHKWSSIGGKNHPLIARNGTLAQWDPSPLQRQRISFQGLRWPCDSGYPL